MKYLLLFVVTTILLNSTLAFGQAKDAAAPETESSRMEELRRTGLEALYNLDYEKARKDFLRKRDDCKDGFLAKTQRWQRRKEDPK